MTLTVNRVHGSNTKVGTLYNQNANLYTIEVKTTSAAAVNLQLEDSFNSDGVIQTFTFVPGSGYTNGTYTNIPLSWVFNPSLAEPNTNPTVNLTISGGIVTNVVLNNPGVGISANAGFIIDAVATPALSTGANFSLTASTVSNTDPGLVDGVIESIVKEISPLAWYAPNDTTGKIYVVMDKAINDATELRTRIRRIGLKQDGTTSVGPHAVDISGTLVTTATSFTVA
jgi:hypothetical protein